MEFLENLESDSSLVFGAYYVILGLKDPIYTMSGVEAYHAYSKLICEYDEALQLLRVNFERFGSNLVPVRIEIERC